MLSFVSTQIAHGQGLCQRGSLPECQTKPFAGNGIHRPRTIANQRHSAPRDVPQA